MFALFAMPSSSSIITDAGAVVTTWVPEFLPLVAWALGIAVVVAIILFFKRQLISAVNRIFGTSKKRSKARRR